MAIAKRPGCLEAVEFIRQYCFLDLVCENPPFWLACKTGTDARLSSCMRHTLSIRFAPAVLRTLFRQCQGGTPRISGCVSI